MIFIIFGTTKFPFTRLAEVAHRILGEMTDNVYVQSGWTDIKVKYANITPFMNHETFIRKIKSARIVITQGGEGSVLEALRWAKGPPIIFPRDVRYREQVDSQQVEVGKFLTLNKLALVGESKDQVLEMVRNYSQLKKGLKKFNPKGWHKKMMFKELDAMLHKI